MLTIANASVCFTCDLPLQAFDEFCGLTMAAFIDTPGIVAALSSQPRRDVLAAVVPHTWNHARSFVCNGRRWVRLQTRDVGTVKARIQFRIRRGHSCIK